VTSAAKADSEKQALYRSAEQLAEKLDVALDFGWRSGLPLR